MSCRNAWPLKPVRSGKGRGPVEHTSITEGTPLGRYIPRHGFTPRSVLRSKPPGISAEDDAFQFLVDPRHPLDKR